MADDARTGIAANEVILLKVAGGPDPSMPPEVFYEGQGGGQPNRMVRNVSQPSVTVYRPAPGKANGVGVIVAPGGGWRILAWEHEGVWLAEWLAERGYCAFLLKYRVRPTPEDPAEFAAQNARGGGSLAETPATRLPRSITDLLPGEKWDAARERAVEDGRTALAMIRERAGDFGVDPAKIGMIGFSAGAFLTVSVALDAGGPPLAFAAPIYGGETGGAPVPADAPPLFTVLAAEDRMFLRVTEGLYRDWVEADRPAEIHVFASGGHGFGLTPQNKPLDRWLELFGAWLKDLGLG